MIKALAAPPLVAILCLSSLGLSGCSTDDVGYPCQLSAAASTTTSTGAKTAVVVTNALDCLSRLCVRPTTSMTTAAGLCSKVCESDDDCPGANDACKSQGGTAQPYVCRVVKETGGLACCKMCVCSAFVAGTTDTTTATCANATPTCPKL